MPIRATDVREAANSHLHHGKQTSHEVDSSFPADCDLQFPHCLARDGNGSLVAQCDNVTRRGANKGGAHLDRMELEGIGEDDASF